MNFRTEWEKLPKNAMREIVAGVLIGVLVAGGANVLINFLYDTNIAVEVGSFVESNFSSLLPNPDLSQLDQDSFKSLSSTAWLVVPTLGFIGGVTSAAIKRK